MKRLGVYVFAVIFLMAVMGGGAFALHAAAMGARHTTTSHLSTVSLAASIDQKNTVISARIEYSAPGNKKIRAVQLLVNDTPREIRIVQPSTKGISTILVDLSSLPKAERTKPIRLQARTFWLYNAKHPSPSKVAAVSKTIVVTPQSGTPGGNEGGGSVAIPQTSAIPDESRLTTYQDNTIVKDEIIVGLGLNLANPDQRIKEIANQAQGTIAGSVPGTGTYQLRFEGLNLDQLEAKRQTLEKLTDVSFASHHFIGNETAVPNDPEYPTGSWSDTVFNQRNWGLKYIKAPQAWDLTTGNGSVGIGIIDGEFNTSHEDLNQNIISSTGFKNASTDNLSWHGTHVAGIACASGNNGIGITGVNWQCSMRLYAPAIRSEFSAMHTMELMKQAADDGARVVNMSIGWVDSNNCGKAGNDQALQQVREVNQVLERGVLWGERHDKDVLWVFSAGNACRDVKYNAPASLTLTHPSNVMAVAAVGVSAPDKDAPLYDRSNFGAGITVAAPGVDIYSTLTSCIIFTSICAPSYSTKSGTSMAAPYVTGLAGLVYSKHPDFTASQVRQCIVDAANTYGHSVPGQGFKVISAPEAITCQKPTPPTDTPDCVFERGTLTPGGCASTNPTVEVRYFKPSTCPANVEITWDQDDPSTKEVFDVSSLAPGAETVLGRHTFATPGDHWIKEDPRSSTGESCVFVALSFLFRLEKP